MRLKTNEIVVIIGMRGYGKTTLAKYLLKNIQRRAIMDILDRGWDEFPERFIPQSSAEYEGFFKECWKSGNLMVCVDEADLVFPKHKELSGVFHQIVQLGRRRNIGLTAISRRPASLHTDIFSLADHVFIFRLFSPADMRFLREFLGGYEKTVQTLQKREFCYYNGEQFLRCPPLELAKKGDLDEDMPNL